MAGIGFPGRVDEEFRDRGHAGRLLAEQLRHHEWRDPVVLGLARGGVPVAVEVAAALGAPLRVSVARKVGAPGHPELALGAVTADGPPSYDPALLRSFGLSEADLAGEAARERDEARRREERYQQDDPVELRGRDVILVDDGVATGATARAVVRMLRESEPRSITVAVPVAASEAVSVLSRETDAVVCVLQPASFTAVGQWYRDFHATGDDEILAMLRGVR